MQCEDRACSLRVLSANMSAFKSVTCPSLEIHRARERGCEGKRGMESERVCMGEIARAREKGKRREKKRCQREREREKERERERKKERGRKKEAVCVCERASILLSHVLYISRSFFLYALSVPKFPLIHILSFSVFLPLCLFII